MTSLTAPGAGPNRPVVGRQVPKPRVPPRPVLSLRGLGRAQSRTLPSVLAAGDSIEVTSGRAAIALALRAMGLKRGERVMIPAYHCPAMVDPVLWAGGEAVFYRIRRDLSADLDDVAAKIATPARALMVVNYFGFPQPLDALRDFCDRNGLVLIEDCAHSAFGSIAGRRLGSFGDYAIACHTKFYPTFEGGALIFNRPDRAPVPLEPPGPMFNLNAAVTTIQRALSYGRLWALEPLVALAEAAVRRARGARAPQQPDAQGPVMEAGIPGQFAAEWTNKRMSLVSRAICGVLSGDRIVARRRENYRRLCAGLKTIPGLSLLHPDLPDGVVPHVVPVVMDRLDEVFPLLEDAAVPMQRFGQFLWEGVDDRTCSVSASLSRHGLQLPCHQDLSPEDVDWIADQVRIAARAVVAAS